MKKSLPMVTMLLAVSGCTSQNNIAKHNAAELSQHEHLASKLVSIEYHEVEKGTKLALFSYINDKGQFCFQWVESAKKTNFEIETTIAAHCGEYETRNIDSTRMEYIPVGVKAVNEYQNSDGLLVQSLEI